MMSRWDWAVNNLRRECVWWILWQAVFNVCVCLCVSVRWSAWMKTPPDAPPETLEMLLWNWRTRPHVPHDSRINLLILNLMRNEDRHTHTHSYLMNVRQSSARCQKLWTRGFAHSKLTFALLRSSYWRYYHFLMYDPCKYGRLCKCGGTGVSLLALYMCSAT